MPHKPHGSRFARWAPTNLRRLKPVIRAPRCVTAYRWFPLDGIVQVNERSQAPFLHPGTNDAYIYHPEITPPAQVGWFVSCLLVSAEPTWISTWVATWVCLPFAATWAACLFHIPLSFVEYIVRLRTICIYTFRPLHMPLHSYYWKPQCGNDVSSHSLNNKVNKLPSWKKSQ